MSPIDKKTWFRFSLPTAIVLMLTMGLMVGASIPFSYATPEGSVEFQWGWPIESIEQYPPDTSELVVNYVLNLLPNGLLLAAIWYGCEFHLFRKRSPQ